MRKEKGFTPQVTAKQVHGTELLQEFLTACVKALNKDLVLMVEGLDGIHIGPLREFLRAFRAIYEQRDTGSRCLTVVIAGSLDLPSFGLDSYSTFVEVARLFIVNDLPDPVANKFARAVLEKRGVNKFTPEAFQRLMEAVGGDRDLIVRLCHTCVDKILTKTEFRLDRNDVDAAIVDFLHGAAEYPPLLRNHSRHRG